MRDPVRDRDRLEHILSAIDNVLEFAQGKGVEELDTNKLLFYAVVKNIEIMGEAAFKLTKAFCEQHPNTPWKDIMRMRHVLVHDYYQISNKEVWQVITKDLEPLRSQIANYIETVDWEKWEYDEQAIADDAIHKKLVQSAIKMKNDGIPFEKIAQYTGLTKSEIDIL